MRSGKLRHRLTIQRSITTRNDYGEPVADWEDVATVWASVKPLSGREYWMAQQVNAETTHEVSIRYLEGVEPSMRMLFGARVLVIESVLTVDERRREMLILAREDV